MSQHYPLPLLSFRIASNSSDPSDMALTSPLALVSLLAPADLSIARLDLAMSML